MWRSTEVMKESYLTPLKEVNKATLFWKRSMDRIRCDLLCSMNLLWRLKKTSMIHWKHCRWCYLAPKNPQRLRKIARTCCKITHKPNRFIHHKPPGRSITKKPLKNMVVGVPPPFLRGCLDVMQKKPSSSSSFPIYLVHQGSIVSLVTSSYLIYWRLAWEQQVPNI